MQVTSNVYFEKGFRGANVGYITTADGIIMIDTPQKPSEAVTWREEISTRGQLRYLINTEPHGDHITGNFFFPVPVIAQEQTRQDVLKKDPGQLAKGAANTDPDSLPLLQGYQINVPAITFSEQLSVYMGGLSFHLLHLPGHTLGQTAIWIPEEKVVFTGDNVMGKVQPLFHEADPLAWMESLKRISELEVNYILPGHGEICTKSELPEQIQYIQECVDLIRQAVQKGWTEEETLARVSLPRRYPFGADLEKVGPEKLRVSISNLYTRLSQ